MNPSFMIEQPATSILCRYCNNPVIQDDYFCPNCGKKLKDKPVSTGIGKQILVYLISFFLPPFGLPWAFRYLKQNDEKSRIIGYTVITITILSLIINIWLITAFINQTNKAINNDLNGSLNSLYSQ